MRTLATLLVHFPVLDREGRVVTTAITNLDLHDIARSAYTYGLSRYYVVHPIAAQRELAHRVRQHWTVGSGARRIPDRAPPLGGLSIVDRIEDAVRDFGGGAEVELWTTSASASDVAAMRFADARARLATDGPPVLVVFGTGWGLAEEVHQMAHFRLEPLRSPRVDGYNHLSVRAAAAITFDRLRGARETP